MPHIDYLTEIAYVTFAKTAGLACLSYLIATLLARLGWRIPWEVYFARLGIMAFFFLALWGFWVPMQLGGWSGPSERQYLQGRDSLYLGAFYGMYTYWVWVLIALWKWPRKTSPQEKVDTSASPEKAVAPENRQRLEHT